MGYKEPYSGRYDYVGQKGISAYTNHELYSTWRMMNIRCYDTRHKSYHRYGGRGIEVCEEWRWDNPFGFINFLEHVGLRPEGTTLDKNNNDDWYKPGNVSWELKKVQQNNLGIGLANISGELGVSWDETARRWVAQICLNGATKNIGVFNFEDKDKAAARYEEVKSVKVMLGDAAALEFYDSLKDKTPVGKQKRRNKTSKFYGVARNNKPAGGWRAFTNEKSKGKIVQISLGVHETEELAYSAVLRRMRETGRINEEDYELERRKYC